MKGSDMLAVWIPIFAALLEETGMTKEKIKIHVQLNNSEFVKKIALLNSVLPEHLHTNGDDKLRKLPTATARAATITLCESLFKLLISKLKLVVLVIEDIHWASSLELRLLIGCCATESGVMVVLNTRPFSDDNLQLSDFTELQSSMTELITLDSFSDDDVKALVKVHFNDSPTIDQFIEIARNLANGLPLLVHKLLSDLKTNGADAFFSKMIASASTSTDALSSKQSAFDNARNIFQDDFKKLSPTTFKLLSLVAAHAGKLNLAALRSILSVHSSITESEIIDGLAKLEKEALISRDGTQYHIYH